ncbi:MAG: hypothetical protein WC564_01030 [Patescibacteria group bacterium]|jgi:cbb3-type cytochrome oxidase subunit 3
MKKKINKIVFPLVSLLVFLSLFFIMNKVFAVDSSYGLDSTIQAGGLAVPLSVSAVGNDPGNFVSSKVGQIVGAVLSFVGILLLILVIYAGILWMTSAGNEKQTEQAKSILTSAIIGLIIVLSAYAITSFIGSQLTQTVTVPNQGTTATLD